MLYIIFSFAVSLLALLALFEWRRSRFFQGKRLSKKLLHVRERLALGQWERAAELLAQLGQAHPDSLSVLITTAQLLHQTGRDDQAMEVIESALVLDPNSLLALKEKGGLLLTQGRSAEALDAFGRCMPLLRDEEDLLKLATGYFMEELPEYALQTLEPLLSDSENGPLLALAGDCLFAKGEKKAALCLYERAQRSRLYNASITARKGQCLKQLGRFTEAIRCFSEILQRDPSNVSATLSLGACYEAKGQFDIALLVYTNGKASEEGDRRLLKHSGVAAVYAERYSEAIDSLRAALLKGDPSAKTLVFLGYCFERQEKWEEAEAIYHQAVSDHPDHPAGYRGLAWLYGVGRSRTLDQDAGLGMARRSLDLLSDAVSWEVLSACEARAGNFEEAHQIQEHLTVSEEDQAELVRRREAMRTLRRNVPLDEHLVARTLVA